MHQILLIFLKSWFDHLFEMLQNNKMIYIQYSYIQYSSVFVFMVI